MAAKWALSKQSQELLTRGIYHKLGHKCNKCLGDGKVVAWSASCEGMRHQLGTGPVPTHA